jgi:2-hydroxychromene-2-carboxylate isomerase
MRRDRLVTHELRLTAADMMLQLRNVKDHIDAALKIGAFAKAYTYLRGDPPPLLIDRKLASQACTGGHMEALWYFDLVSPFAYLALGEIEDLATRMPVIFKPVLFGAMLSHWGQLGPAEIAPKRVQTYRICVWTARERGLPFRFPPSHPFNPLMLLRVLTALDAPPHAVRTLFDLIWREGRDPQAPETLGLARQRLGIEDLDVLIERGDAKAKLRIATEEAIRAGVFGVPTLALGKELFWGTDAMPLARAYLANPRLFEDEEMRRVDHLPTGVVRRRPGLAAAGA